MEMLDQNPITPFGQRPLSLSTVKAPRDVRECPEGKPAHKWQVFRNICEARASLAVSDRALVVLNALLSFHPDTVLTAVRRRSGRIPLKSTSRPARPRDGGLDLAPSSCGACRQRSGSSAR